MAASSSLQEPQRCHVWFADDRLVAAVWVHRDGYIWCQSWGASEDLVSLAITGAARWDVAPHGARRQAGPGPDDPMVALRWLRCVVLLAREADTRDDEDWLPIDGPRTSPTTYLRALLSGGLRERTELTTLIWPSLTVETAPAEPDISMKHEIERRRQRARELQRRHSAESRLIQQQLDLLRQERARLDGVAHQLEVDRETLRGREQDSTRTLTEAELRAVVETSMSRRERWPWCDSFLDALERWAVEVGVGSAASSLIGILRSTIAATRARIDPYEGFLEAPDAVADLYQAHAVSIAQLSRVRETVTGGIISDVVSAFCRDVDDLPTWGVLMLFGAERRSPPAYTDDPIE